MDNRQERLDEIRNELFDLANSYAGEGTFPVGCHLHESCNQILYAMRMLERGVTQEDRDRTLKMAMMKQSLDMASIMVQAKADGWENDLTNQM